MKKDLSRAGEILDRIFEKIMPERAAGYSRFFSDWSRIVGEKAALHVRPRDIAEGVLILETHHPGWSQQILLSKERILEFIARHHPDLNVRDLRVVVGGDDGKSP